MSYGHFELSFWHPFGPHSGETSAQILARKRREIADNGGWTLWSFQHRRPQTLADWHAELRLSQQDVFVFCSDSKAAVDPANGSHSPEVICCQAYQALGSPVWERVPAALKIPHPFSKSTRFPTAFIVQEVIHPVEDFEAPAVEWFAGPNTQWRCDSVPTRGEYLIRPGGTARMRKVCAILRLRSPYLAVLSAE